MTPMYFSLITPAPGQAMSAAHERAQGAYADHQWLWRWFPAAAGSARDFLFRRDEHEGLPRYYVVSARPPSAPPGAWHCASKHYAPTIEAGERLRFELRANPTVRHDRDGKSKRHDVVMEAKKQLLAQRGLTRWSDWQEPDKPALHELVHRACSAWLARRGDTMGFRIEPQSLTVESHQQHREKPGGELQFTSVDLAGELTVTDAAAFTPALLHGVGRARAFGCGLMLVRRAG